MRLSVKTYILAAIAILGGLVVLLGYFVHVPILTELRLTFLYWTVVLAAFMLLVGVLNLMRTHWRKVTRQQPGAIYSLILLFSLFLTIGALIIEQAGLFGASGWSLWAMSYIIIPVEGSLMAVLAVVLAYSIARLLNRRLNLFSLIFVATTLLVILGTASYPGFEIPGLRNLRDWFVQVPAVAGARGILLGVGLGTVATGLRILMGADRPYGG